jgi:hypothetical protein
MRTSLRPLLAETKQCIHAAPDLVSLERARLVTEAYRLHAAAPMPLRCARAFAHYTGIPGRVGVGLYARAGAVSALA